MKSYKPANMDQAKVIEVIETTMLRRGDGKEDPIRVVTQYWSRDGDLLAERDPYPPRSSEDA